MATTKYSHAFLVGSLNVDALQPDNLDLNLWKRQILSTVEYEKLKSDYYKGLVDSMVEAEGQTRPNLLDAVQHFSISMDTECKSPMKICLTKGLKKIPYDYSLCLCQLHLYFFPHDVVLVSIEIDDTGTDLDLMTLGHGSLINLQFNDTGNEDFLEKVKPLTNLLKDNDLKHLVKDGNNLKILQIVEVEAERPDDKLLYEIGAFLPVGAVGGNGPLSPSDAYFSSIMSENSVSAFFNWKALALVDSFTVLGVNGFNTWTWLHHYYPLIYLRCIFEKTFCFSRNSAYRLGCGAKDLSLQIADMEKYYFYDNISYNFLPTMLHAAMSKGLGLKEEREEISKQIKERAKEEDEKRQNRITLGLSAFAIFSVAWDLCSIYMKAFTGDDNRTPAIFLFFVSFIAIIVLAIYIYRKKK